MTAQEARGSAFLFDMDGVVVDNMSFHEIAWREFLGARGIEMEAAEFRRATAGMPTREVMAYYFKRPMDPGEAARLDQEKEAAYRKLYAPHLAPLPGARKFLAASREAGIRVGLGTGSLPENIDFVLDGLDLRRFFDAVVGAGDVKKGKPDPEVFLKLAGRLGVAPRDCVVFEDSILGERAAAAAGMRVVAVTTSHPASEFKSPVLAIPDFSAVSPRDVLARGKISASAKEAGRFRRPP